MLVALIAHDKHNALDIRLANRSAHIEYLKSTDLVAQAGPLLNDADEMAGSLIILDVPDMTAAQAWADDDPYAKAGLFHRVELIAWSRVIG